MKKMISLLLALFLTVGAFMVMQTIPQQTSSRESFVIARVIDGDTFQLNDGTTIRLLNINAPEKGVVGATLSKQLIEALKDQPLEGERIDVDKYQRVLAKVYALEYLNRELVKQGLASKFLVQEDELAAFAEAESDAIAHERGIWKHAPEFGCAEATVDAKAEQVLLHNRCSPFSLNNWTLKDESRKTYHFFNRSLGTSLTLHSTYGFDNASDIYWNYEQSVWNDDRDTLYLFDENGNIAATATYGY